MRPAGSPASQAGGCRRPAPEGTARCLHL